MMKKLFLFTMTAMLFSFFPPSCWAQWTMDFIRITCIPEARYLHVTYSPIAGPTVLLDTQHDKKRKKQRLLAWQKHGYYDPAKVQYECRMPGSIYKISTTQPPPQERGECGVSQSITLSLLWNDKPVLDRIILGANCFKGPTVDKFEISDGLNGWQSRDMTLCVSAKDGEAYICKYFSEGEILQAIPIHQDDLEKFMEKKR